MSTIFLQQADRQAGDKQLDHANCNIVTQREAGFILCVYDAFLIHFFAYLASAAMRSKAL